MTVFIKSFYITAFLEEESELEWLFNFFNFWIDQSLNYIPQRLFSQKAHANFGKLWMGKLGGVNDK